MCCSFVSDCNDVTSHRVICRQLMVMDETYVINQLKEDLCFVSTQFTQDMEIARFAIFYGSSRASLFN